MKTTFITATHDQVVKRVNGQVFAKWSNNRLLAIIIQIKSFVVEHCNIVMWVNWDKKLVIMINSRSRPTKTVWFFEGLNQSSSVRGEDLDWVVTPVTHDHVTIISDRYGRRINQMPTDDLMKSPCSANKNIFLGWKHCPWMTMTSSDVVNPTKWGNLILSPWSFLSPIVLIYIH